MSTLNTALAQIFEKGRNQFAAASKSEPKSTGKAL